MSRKYVSIPIEIWNLSELHPNERVLLAEVASFDEQGKPCFAGNDHFAKLLNVSEATARGYISSLISAGYLIREGSRYNRRLRKSAQTNAQNSADECVKSRRRVRKSTQTSAQNSAHTNTYTNTLTKTITKSTHSRADLVLPWESDQFKSLWTEWKKDRKERRIKNYTQRGEQAVLKKLYDATNGNEADAIERIEIAIANQWQGLVFGESKNSRTKRGGKASFESGQLQRQLRELAETGHIAGDNRNRL